MRSKPHLLLTLYGIVNEEDKAVALGKLAAYRAASSAWPAGTILGQSVTFEPKGTEDDIAVSH